VTKRKKIVVGILILLLLIVVGSLLAFNKSASAPEKPAEQTKQKTEEPPKPQPKPPPVPAKPETPNKQTSTVIEDPMNILVVVNKIRSLPSTFVPSDLVATRGGTMRSVAAGALNQMLSDAANAGVPMTVISGYRSYNTQASLYNSYVSKDGVAAADRYSARPGYSEHQTGLVADLGNSNGGCALEICFANTAGGQWLIANASRYGFIIRYPEGKESLTGYQYEPWHVRYVGVEVASQIVKSNQILEQYLGLPTSATYR